jgi:hypothetical protein
VLSGTASLMARKADSASWGLAGLGQITMAPIGTTKSYIQKNEGS